MEKNFIRKEEIGNLKGFNREFYWNFALFQRKINGDVSEVR